MSESNRWGNAKKFADRGKYAEKQKIVVQMKDELEQIKEQVLNVM
jgi:uncharacterized protein YicC (UPF0701 family)